MGRPKIKDAEKTTLSFHAPLKHEWEARAETERVSLTQLIEDVMQGKRPAAQAATISSAPRLGDDREAGRLLFEAEKKSGRKAVPPSAPVAPPHRVVSRRSKRGHGGSHPRQK